MIKRAEGFFYKLFFRSKYLVAGMVEVIKNQPDYYRIEYDGKLLGEKVMCKTIGIGNCPIVI